MKSTLVRLRDLLRPLPRRDRRGAISIAAASQRLHSSSRFPSAGSDDREDRYRALFRTCRLPRGGFSIGRARESRSGSLNDNKIGL